MRGIGKRFSGVEVLRAVDFDVVAGEVHARRGGQHHVGELHRLGGGDVLDDGELEIRKPLAHLVHVGLGEEGVLAEHVQGLDVPARRALADLGIDEESSR